MTARWRSLLRMRAVLRLLLEEHVPLGALSRIAASVTLRTDEDLLNENRTPSMTAALARDILHELLGDDVELIDRDVPLPNQELIDWIVKQRPIARPPGMGPSTNPRAQHPGEPSDLLRVHDEIERRRKARKLAAETSIDGPAAEVADELDELLAFMAPLHGRPLPDLARFEEWLDGQDFYEVMHAYRMASVVRQSAVCGAFEAAKAAIRTAARR